MVEIGIKSNGKKIDWFVRVFEILFCLWFILVNGDLLWWNVCWIVKRIDKLKNKEESFILSNGLLIFLVFIEKRFFIG